MGDSSPRCDSLKMTGVVSELIWPEGTVCAGEDAMIPNGQAIGSIPTNQNALSRGVQTHVLPGNTRSIVPESRRANFAPQRWPNVFQAAI